ncbi:hypothetical protein [Halioglobus sp. Uisw_031]|uniref:hypothetical protein n=1 Tax=Halioglobus sp. Uisw_031 TaxID=3230977 RepID=UPI0039EB9D89
MWEKTKPDDECASESMLKGIDNLIDAAKKHKDRQLFESQLDHFIGNARRGYPIPDSIMCLTADVLERLMRGQGVVKVSDVIGPRKSGSRGRKSIEKQAEAKKVAQIFIGNKLFKEMGYQENLEKTGDECGLSDRTVATIIKDYADREPAFRYLPKEYG